MIQIVWPWSQVKRLTITATHPSFYNGEMWIENLTFRPVVDLAVVDPIPELQSGKDVSTSPESLATLGNFVGKVATDSANRVVIRAKSNFVGERLKFTVLNESGQSSTSVLEDGAVGPIRGSGQVTSVGTSKGPYGFALYRPPADFSRAGRDDSADRRKIFLKVESLDFPTATFTSRLS